VDHWLGPIRNVVRWNKRELDAITDDQARFDRVVELNVLEQIYHLSETPVIQQAWAKGRRPLLHGLVYDLREGILHEIATGVDSQEAADQLAEQRLSGVPAGPPPTAPRAAHRAASAAAASDGPADPVATRGARADGTSRR
jgi:carbonic anhydrase